MTVSPLQIDLGASQVPDPVFIVVHLVILVIAAAFAIQLGKRGGTGKMVGAFSIIAVAEVVYVLYHVNVTTFLLSHTVAEVLLLVAVILFFAGVRAPGAGA